MSEKSRESVLGALPHSRAHRRSDKRAARPQPPGRSDADRAASPSADRAPSPSADRGASPNADRAASPSADPEAGDRARSHPGAPLDDPAEIAATVVRAAIELAEIGATAGLRALRSALSRLPRP